MSRLPGFDVLVSQALSFWKQTPVEPVELRGVLLELRSEASWTERLSDSPELFAKAVSKLQAGGADSLTARDDVVLAGGLTGTSPLLGDKSLIQHESLLKALLTRWRRLTRHPVVGPLVWFSLFQAYFLADDPDSRTRLRRYLHDTLDQLDSGPLSPAWVRVVRRHREVLGGAPASGYIREWFDGSSAALEEIMEQGRIPPGSWFWQEFVAEVLSSASVLEDREFLQLMPRLLDLAGRFPLLVDTILAGVLNRYAEADAPVVQPALLELVLEHWGSPQLSTSGKGFRWSQASESAARMVSRWLAEDDLRDFFEIIRSSKRNLSQLDQRRLTYWLRFTDRMDFTRLVLGSAYRHSNNPDVRKFVAKRKDRLSWLDESAADNMAILMKMGTWWAVEFAQSGYACYVYANEALPFSIQKTRLSVPELRDRRSVQERLIHSGAWEEKFDIALWELGIRPNSVNTPRARDDRRVASPERQAGTTEVLLPADLQRELERIQTGTVDNRRGGGRYWIELGAPPSTALVAAMAKRGYRFARSRGFYK